MREIHEIAKHQRTHKVDLPKDKRVRLRGARVYIREIPHTASGSIGLPLGVTPHTYLPPAERTYVKGREWSIQS